MENEIDVVTVSVDELAQSIVEQLAVLKPSELRNFLDGFSPVDIAAAVEELETDKLLRIFRIISKNLSAEVFAYLDPDAQSRLVQSITDRELEALLDDLFLDDTVDFLEEVPANIVKRVLARSDEETRSTINRFLQYPERSAGSLMTIEMVELKFDLTAAQAINQIRLTGVDKETVYTCYCIDASRRLLGAVPLHSLLICPPETVVGEIMEDSRQLIFVHTLDDRETVADLAKKYDLLSVPVVDNEQRLVGIITIDDIVDVIVEETTEDFEKMASLRPADDGYLKTGVFSLAKNRIPWLLILMISATLTGKIIEHYETMLAAVLGLTAAIPMLMGTGGNAGSQVSTLMVRGIALGEVKVKDFFKVLFKEVRVALICGVVLAAANFVRMYFFASTDNLMIYFVVSAAMLCAVVVAKLVGCSLPILAKLLHLDPALMAGPLISTLVDAITLMIYFAFARLFLF